MKNAFLCLLLLVSSCTFNCNSTPPVDGGGGTPGGGGPPGDGGGTPTDAIVFKTVSDKIFTPHCTQCHGNGVATGGFSVDTYAAVMKQVVAKDAANSNVYYMVQTTQMPPGGALTSDLINLLHDWIQEGALEK